MMPLSDALQSRDPAGSLVGTSILRHDKPTTNCYRWTTALGKAALERDFRGLGVAIGNQTESTQGWWIHPGAEWQSEP